MPPPPHVGLCKMSFREFCLSLNSMTTFYIQQFGCRATQADGAALERQLLDRGCTPAPDPASASIVVLNTCTVTAAADAQARDAIRKIHAHNPAAQLIVTGCYAQRAPEELATLPGVSWVVGNFHKPQIPNLVTQIASAHSVGAGLAPPDAPSPPSAPDAPHIAPTAATGASQSVNVIASEARNPLFPPTSPILPRDFVGAQHVAPHLGTISNPADSPHPAQILSGDIFAHPEFLSAPIQGGESHHTRPILKIQDGCNNRCSFCVIPYVRGKSRSLPPDAVIREIQALTSPNAFASPVGQPIQPPQNVAREIVLSGINLGTYGRDLVARAEFIDLLRRILDETSLERLRISSIEPQDVTQDLIELFASTDRMAQHFHMPLQSASDRILAAMHRWYRS